MNPQASGGRASSWQTMESWERLALGLFAVLTALALFLSVAVLRTLPPAGAATAPASALTARP